MRIAAFVFMVSTTLCTANAYASASWARAAQALDAWQLEDAMAYTAKLLMQNPNDPDVRALVAEVMHQRGHHEQALAFLGEGRLAMRKGPNASRADTLHRPAQERLADMLPQLRGSAHYAPTFLTLRTPHFRIAYQDKDEITAFYAQDVLEAAYARIGGDLNAYVAEQGEPIAVEIYPTAQGLSQATGLTMANIESSGTIAVCKYHRLMVISPLATLTGYAWADTLAHELTHLIISKRSHNNVPIWLHEGIAKYYESRWRDRAGMALSAHSEQLLKRATEHNTLIPFARMHPSMAKLPSQHDAALAFAEVFAMVEHVVARQGPKAIARALEALGEGQAFDAVLVRHLGGTMDQLERQWRAALRTRRYRKNDHLGEGTVALGPLQAQKPEKPLTALSMEDVDDPQAADDLRLGELCALRGHFAAAVVPYERAYERVGSRLPALGLRLAQALHQAHARPKALQVLAATVAAHPQMAEAQALYARLLGEAGRLQQAIPHLRAYTLHNPFNPELHTLWAQAFAEAHDPQAAARETRFAQLAAAPRAVVPTPAPPQGEGMLTVLSVPWDEICIDGEVQSEPTPIWQRPMAVGAHALQRRTQPSHPFAIRPQAVTHVVLPAIQSAAAP